MNYLKENLPNHQIPDPRNVNPEEFIAAIVKADFTETAGRKLLSAIIKNGVTERILWNQLHRVPLALIQQIPQFSTLTLLKTTSSSLDGFRKLLFETVDGGKVETVVIPLEKTNAYSLCLSSQLGCVMGCRFCYTASMKMQRNLHCYEIMVQFLQARSMVETDGGKVTGIVYMGMGEPFLNYQNVMNSIDLIRAPFGGALRGDAITISSVGILPALRRFIDEGRRSRLTISLTAATEEKRKKIMPMAAKTSLQELFGLLKQFHQKTHQRVGIAWVMIQGFNTSEEDAMQLAQLVGDLPIRLDLIDVNDPRGKYLPPSTDELNRFRDALRKQLAQPVVRRYSGGADIMAACGLLAGE
jgi:23S rRNA (adenine2503-C2)-methyltransferase